MTAFTLRALHHPDRLPAALCVLVAGLTHVPLIPDHLEEAPYVGILFIALAVVSVLLTLALLVRDSPAVWTAVVAVMGLSVVAFLASRTVGLPLMPDDVGNWWGEAMGLPAVTAEALATVLGVTVLAGSRRVDAPAAVVRAASRFGAGRVG